MPDFKTNRLECMVVINLNLKIDEILLNQNVDLIEDAVLRALKRYENDPSIKGIETNV